MRKTLTVLTLIAAAGSLAACKMPWEKTEAPAPTVAAAEPSPEAATTPAPTGEAVNTATPATEAAKTPAPAQATPANPAPAAKK